MDQYERILADVWKRTSNDSLSWEHASPSMVQKVVVNADHVVRAFTASYDLGNTKYNLLFVEVKTPALDDLDNVFERREYELHVLDLKQDLVLSLVDGAVDRADLYRLATLINEKNGKAQAFFRAFEENMA